MFPRLVALAFALASATAVLAEPVRKTTVAIDGQAFFINGRPTYEGRQFRGMTVEGLLMNARLVQGIFDDRNSDSRPRWKYPDGPWDPDRNTSEFLAAMPTWHQHGLLSFTICLQGGSPEGYSKSQPWWNSAFKYDGSLDAVYMARLERILDRADELGMVPIVSYFYFGQSARFESGDAVRRAVENATDWLTAKAYKNVIVEIANEVNIGGHPPAIKPPVVHELIKLVQDRSRGHVENPAGRLLVSTSFGGGAVPTDNVITQSDFVLLHGNGMNDPSLVRGLVDKVRASGAYRNQPVLFNEDDHFDFDHPDNNFLAALSKYASWGYFDYRLKGEGFDEGFQSVPVNWKISSARKRGFFDLLSQVTGSKAP